MEAIEQLHVLAGTVGENNVHETKIGVGCVGIPGGFAGWETMRENVQRKDPDGVVDGGGTSSCQVVLQTQKRGGNDDASDADPCLVGYE